jgi:hypothetical protein
VKQKDLWRDSRARRLPSGAGDDETGFVGGDHGLCAVAEPELAQDVADVRLDGLVAVHEAVGDLVVREPGCDQAEDLELAAGERVEVLGTGALRRGGGRTQRSGDV